MATIPELYKKAQALPETPGVYIMKNAAGEIIYIGKAKVLKNRVSQYFGSQNNHTVKVRKMVENVNDFDYILVSTEYEALVLECSLIKQNSPKYNILLKDDKGYHYVKVENNGWRTVKSAKQRADDGARYIGPYTSSEYVNSAVKQAQDIFMLPHCGKKFPRDINPHGRPCLNYHIRLCSGACCGKITMAEHETAVDEAVAFITGNRNEYVKLLREQMNEASEALEFEKAAKYRDRIKAIENISLKQHVVSVKCASQDVFGMKSINKKTCIAVLRFRESVLAGTETYVYDRFESYEEEYTEFLENYYTEQNDFPKRICVDTDLNQLSFLQEAFTELNGKKVEVMFPRAGEGTVLIEMARKNAEEKLSRILAADDKKKSALHELQEVLHLPNLPVFIEAYDISNQNGSQNVAGMVVFADGRPYKKCYRRFMIKSFQGQDDYRSMAEVIQRRIIEYRTADYREEGFGRKPDLILLDGGLGQINAVLPVMKKYGFDVPIFGMIKDSSHKTRAIASNGGEIAINDNRSLFTLIAQIQEEVHRYAIGYHRTVGKKEMLEMTLLKIEGIGKTRAELLLKRFLTLEGIQNAEPEDLMKVKGMTEQAALNVYRYFRNKPN